MLFDQQNFATCSLIGQWKSKGGKPYLLMQVEGIEVKFPEGRLQQINEGYSLDLLRSCNEFYCGNFPTLNQTIGYKRKDIYILYAGNELNAFTLTSAVISLKNNQDMIMSMYENLKKNNGIISYWDSKSLAIVCNDYSTAENILKFMKNMAISYNPVQGLILSRVN